MKDPKHPLIMTSGIAATAAWLALFGLGLLINSKPYRDQLTNAFNWHAFIASLFVYTPTNIAALCLVAAFCGGCASRMILHARSCASAGHGDADKSEIKDTDVYMSENPVSSMLRGFAVYVAFLAGVYITANSPFGDPTPDQYARAAGSTSLLAFVVGYDPTFFRGLINIAEKFKGKGS